MDESQPSSESRENELVEVKKIKAVFNDPDVLQAIRSSLLDAGLVSGGVIAPVDSAYQYDGKRIEEAQYSLTVLVPKEKSTAEIRDLISAEIRKHWDVPYIDEEETRVPRYMLDFLGNAAEEHKKVRGLKRTNRILKWTAAAVVGLLGVGGVERYAEHVRTQEKREALTAALTEMETASRKVEALLIDTPEALRKRFEAGQRVIGHDAEGKAIWGWVIPQREGDVTESGALPKEIWDAIHAVRAAEFKYAKLKRELQD